MKNADIVLCSNPVTVKEVSRWNKNVLFSLDYQEHEYPFLKRDYSINGKMKLFWEGQGLVLPQLLFYKNVFKRIRDFCELHIVTSETFPLYDPFYKVRTENFLKKFPIEAYYHKWNQKNNAALFSKFDCGIIPLDPRDKYKWHKPANKLIAFWFSGIPTLTSDTPAYREIGEKTTDDFLCKSEEEWVQKLESIYKMSADDRKHIAERNYAFVSKVFSNEEMDDHWNKIIKTAAEILERRSLG
ncbi:MAG: glycosyltransferase family 1 protein [Chitinophagaceae bacterium]|nr:glycosyltransferase family 1 protein [Chitinophagaceae bacterium]